jgi:integrase
VAKRLTAAAVARLKAGPKRRSIPDGGGLFLLIQPSGAKSWALFFRGAGGRMVKLTLGPLATEENSSAKLIVGAPLTLAGARKLAADINLRRAGGEDVVASRERERAAREAAAANTFAVAARNFITEYAMPKVRGWREQASLLGLRPSDEGLTEIKGGLCERWRNRPIGSIDADDIFAVVDETRKRGAPGLERRSEGKTESRARSMYRTLSKMFNWLVAQRRIKANPCAGVDAPETPRARERVLSDDEIKKFWSATEKLGPPFGVVLRLCLLTGQRLNEIAGLRWSELVGEEIHLPPARTKNHRAHVVPLSSMAREIIAAVKPFPGSPHLFTTIGARPISGWSRTKRRLDALIGDVPAWKIHDLRRTAVTGMARAGANLAVVERAVNHVSGSFGGIVGVYQQHKFRDEVRNALERWADLLARIVS